MGELEEKLESVLSDPEAMARIMSLAKSLDLGSGQSRSGTAPESAPPPETPSPAPQRAAGGDLLEGLSCSPNIRTETTTSGWPC